METIKDDKSISPNQGTTSSGTTLETTINNSFDECFNTGVDACSSIVKIFEGSHEPAIKALVPFLLKELEQLKKHI